MGKKKYEVLDSTGHILATGMDLATALLLMEASCDKYFMEKINLCLRETEDTADENRN